MFLYFYFLEVSLPGINVKENTEGSFLQNSSKKQITVQNLNA